MNKWILVFAAATAIGIAAIPKQADAQVYVRDGARYCFYYDGWHGPGWYQCGYRWRQGLGWGGGYDWGIGFGWHHPGWERRHGRHHAGDRPRVFRQGDAVIRSQQQPGVIRGQTTTQAPTMGRATVRSGSAPAVRSGTTGAGQGGMNAAPSVSRGGGGGGGGGSIGGGGGGSIGGGGGAAGSSGGGGSVSGPGKQP